MANEVDYIPCKYRGNGLTSHFSFRWKIFTEKDIIVQLEDVVSGKQVIQQYATDYSVSFNDVGGFVSFVNPPTEDSYIVISRNVSDYQSKTYSTSTGFQGSELEDSFDEVSCNIQELEYDLKRAIKVPVGSSVLNLDLPLPQAGKTLKWNKEENGLVNSTINVDTLENIANRLYESVDNVDLVAENTENIKAVNENKANINIVANSIENVNTVGNNIANVNAVAENQTNINAVNDNATNINTVANSIGNVNSVGTNIEAVKSVNANEANINAVNENKANINTVASAIENVNTVGNDIANVIAVAENQTNINTVAANGADITTVAGSIKNVNNVGSNIKAVQQVSVIAENVNTVATDILNVHEVGTHINDVVTVKNGLGSVEVVANNIADVQAVETIQESITTVAQNKDTVVSVGNNIATINAVNANKNNINAVAGNEATINAVNANKNNINTVSGLSAKISAVVDNETNINIVANSIENVNTVGNNIANVNAVASNETNINAVNDNATNINTVATNISDVSAVADATADIEVCAGNIEDIKSSPSFAEQAKASAKQSIYRDLFQCNSLNLNAEKPKTYFEHIENLKHSTFDKSKFTVVGSPTITDNGIVSELSNANTVGAIPVINLKGHSWEVKGRWVNNNVTSTVDAIINLGSWLNWGSAYINTSSKTLCLRLKTGDSEGSSTEGLGPNISLQEVPNYLDVSISFNVNTGIYTIYAKSDTGVEYSGTFTATTENKELYYLSIPNIAGFIKYGYDTDGLSAKNSIDLKYSRILIDSTEVFSGNKTGIDVIKENDFASITRLSAYIYGENKIYSTLNSPADVPTVLYNSDGSIYTGDEWSSSDGAVYYGENAATRDLSKDIYLTKQNMSVDAGVNITDDSVLSNCAVHKYVRTSCLVDPNSTDYEIDISFTASNITKQKQICTSSHFYIFALVIHQSKTILFLGDGTTWNIASPGTASGKTVLQNGIKYILKFIRKNDKYFLKLFNTATGEETTEATITSSVSVPLTAFLNLGTQTGWPAPADCAYDLNLCRQYINGELVYQPCLKIPYTESKSGSKIVDVAYRDRVQDVYSQGFDKYYYTLDEANKSVDELTGFNQTLSISKTEDSTVTKFADGTVEICGRVTTAGTINLPVTLKDTNYFCTLTATEKTTTSFTTAQTGDYILKGELA